MLSTILITISLIILILLIAIGGGLLWFQEMSYNLASGDYANVFMLSLMACCAIILIGSLLMAVGL